MTSNFFSSSRRRTIGKIIEAIIMLINCLKGEQNYSMQNHEQSRDNRILVITRFSFGHRKTKKLKLITKIYFSGAEFV